ncbi:hypothetical protein QWY82_06260 [Simiduia curdlanivorans]|uniref:Uncharacterized protein n=1 Tax=Simiduia curdlanivorans TaxID=1492769 RepID=A0ABV8V4K6_9GAMM|nr:hypothetical protein [Simiduia curdlanivorans]MDN3638410.1 hypothetical protein [Simiduia curdlanivorans]
MSSFKDQVTRYLKSTESALKGKSVSTYCYLLPNLNDLLPALGFPSMGKLLNSKTKELIDYRTLDKLSSRSAKHPTPSTWRKLIALYERIGVPLEAVRMQTEFLMADYSSWGGLSWMTVQFHFKEGLPYTCSIAKMMALEESGALNAALASELDPIDRGTLFLSCPSVKPVIGPTAITLRLRKENEPIAVLSDESGAIYLLNLLLYISAAVDAELSCDNQEIRARGVFSSVIRRSTGSTLIDGYWTWLRQYTAHLHGCGDNWHAFAEFLSLKMNRDREDIRNQINCYKSNREPTTWKSINKYLDQVFGNTALFEKWLFQRAYWQTILISKLIEKSTSDTDEFLEIVRQRYEKYYAEHAKTLEFKNYYGA